MSANREPLPVLAGPTASGKTAVSLALAEAVHAEIVSVDSRQIYRGMEIGSAAPTEEERARVPHHLVAELDPGEPMNAGEFGKRVRERVAEIEARGARAILVGGAGLYLRAALGGLDDLPRDDAVRERLRDRVRREGVYPLYVELARRDPAAAEGISPRDGQRITRALEILEVSGELPSALRKRGKETEVPARVAVLERDRADLDVRIRERVGAMIEAGLEEEVRKLLERGLSPDHLALRSVGYEETVRLLRGELDRKDWAGEIVRNTRRYAKRQRTWFRGMKDAAWVRVEPGEAVAEIARRVRSEWEGIP